MKTAIITIAALLCASAAPVRAQTVDAVAVDGQTAFKSECSACHVAYPPRFLPTASWDAVMGGLKEHFGEDASLDAATAEAIRAYLSENAGKPGKDTTLADGTPILRITERNWFTGEHRGEVSAKALQKAGSMSNCTACHSGAADGYFDDD